MTGKHKDIKERLTNVHRSFMRYSDKMSLGEILLLERIFDELYKELEE